MYSVTITPLVALWASTQFFFYGNINQS